MHHGDWNDGWSGGSWIPMMIMMVLFWGGLIWLGFALMRRGSHLGPAHTHEVVAPVAPRPAAREILAERLARGEIEPDDYQQRLDALRRGEADPNSSA